MKAVVYSKYGAPEVLQLKELDKPVPKPNEILVKVFATSVTSGDVRLRASDFPPLFWLPARLIFGLFRPKKQILGHEWSGVIEQLGSKVSKFKIGDEVFGTTTMLKTGAYAEYMCIPEHWSQGVVTKKPKQLSHKEAAVLPIGSMTALFLLQKANIQRDQKVLIYGASGSVGSYAVQIANYFGIRVTGVCSTRNIEMVEQLGAETVIDYKKQDYTQSPERYNIVFDTVGKTSKSAAKKVLKDNGKFVTTKILTKESKELLLQARQLAETEKIKPFIDKEYSLENMVETHRYVDSGRKRGNVSVVIHH
ncbi:NAD(P)-dependent alcohol dehydrogenase [Costertonia aggregata]|uniref:NAD(P)-dependent alcohol dehydrogenase n=1 Tax=Costertonia aggregata TaxID=343403 RepID=A0A7H9AR31_9FLAO|nr:NAD(P)-dependent alcohol dehydrogenase [Costertonia aggregata]QLG45869.1 NAD(P)-dependent alcohol dehydrogenase [Costertonia aggregata]